MKDTSRIISLSVNNISFRESLEEVCTKGLAHQKGFVCFANVHMTIEAKTDPAFAHLLEKAMLLLPDGKPLAVACNWLYRKKQERVAGMDFMPALFRQSDKINGKIFLYGSTETVLEKIKEIARVQYPRATIVGSISPPFRQLEPAELNAHIDLINASGAHFVLVALGCPKQEKWMATNYQSINAILLGLGGAFPVMAGVHKRSPKWMQDWSLEWLYRLFQQPGRMFKRYLYTNSIFIWCLTKELLARKLSISRSAITPKQ